MLRNGLEPWHLLVVLAVVILLFGSKKLPEMARGLGKSMRILKAETAAMREDGPAAEQVPAPVTPGAPVQQPVAPAPAPAATTATATATAAKPEGPARADRPA